MLTISQRISLVTLAITLTVPAQADECGAVETSRHTDPARTRIWATPGVVSTLLFVSDLDVNTDGAARSYHPDDPRGKTLALNNIANATSEIRDARGADLSCRPRSGDCFDRYIRTFEQARDAKWAASGAPQWRSDGMIPWQKRVHGASEPCLIADGLYKGFFVSQTAFSADLSKGVCDQARYLDSLVFHAIVLPGNTQWAANAKNGDLAVVRDLQTGVTAFAIVGDRGPRDALGEGTVALAATLAKVTLNGHETYADVRKLTRPKVLTLVLRGNGIRQRVPGALTQALIDEHAKVVFEAWGGNQRLDACAGAITR